MIKRNARVMGSRVAIILMILTAAGAHAQVNTDSPVFKRYRPPAEPPLIEHSDAIYQIWQTFLVTRRANAGDVLAQHELGLRYLLGRGAATDTTRGAYWIRKAAEQDYTPARFNYAILTYHGWGVPWDPFEAYRNFLFCATRLMPEAEYAMAQFLTENLIVARDYEAAYRWVKLAADSGYAPAKETLAQFQKQGIGKSGKDSVQRGAKVPNTGLVFLDFMPDTALVMSDSLLLREAIRNASPSIRKSLGMSKMLEGETATDSATLAAIRQAADAGSPEALTIVGRSFEKGAGVPRDVANAAACYVRAIRVDSPRARELLWGLLQDKRTLAQIAAAARQGDAVAEFAWGGLSALGFDAQLAQAQVYVTGDQAFRLLSQSGDRGYLPALVETGLCYYAGRWVAQSKERALRTWSDAAARGSKDARVRLAMTILRSVDDTTGWTEAVATLKGAAEEGSVLAEVGLGYCFETGSGVEAIKAEAARYYRAASLRGSQDAFRALRRMHDAIRPEGPEFQIAD